MPPTLPKPRTLQEAIVYFSDPQRAFDYAVKLRWPSGKIVCPRCGSEKNSFIKTRCLWFCYGCQKQFTVKVKTVFEDSALGLDKWLTAMWMIANCKNGISSYELASTLAITQKSAWFMLQRLREAMRESSYGRSKLGGGTPESQLEADETFIGGVTKNMHKDRRLKVEGLGPFKNKTIVHGILDRNLRKVRAMIVPNIKRETLQNAILDNVRYGSSVYTDDAIGFDKLSYRFVHDVVNHTDQYVRGQVHTQGIENFWSLLKRSLRGTYVAVEPFHLSRYVDEQAFRFNHRKDGTRKITDAERVAAVMSQVCGKRLTYSELTGKDESPRHETTGTGEAQQIPF